MSQAKWLKGTEDQLPIHKDLHWRNAETKKPVSFDDAYMSITRNWLPGVEYLEESVSNEKIENKERLVIIYSPLGVEHKYTTSKAVSGDEYKLVKTIECEPGFVKIALLEDGKVVGRAYCMPYYLEMF